MFFTKKALATTSHLRTFLISIERSKRVHAHSKIRLRGRITSESRGRRRAVQQRRSLRVQKPRGGAFGSVKNKRLRDARWPLEVAAPRAAAAARHNAAAVRLRLAGFDQRHRPPALGVDPPLKFPPPLGVVALNGTPRGTGGFVAFARGPHRRGAPGGRGGGGDRSGFCGCNRSGAALRRLRAPARLPIGVRQPRTAGGGALGWGVFAGLGTEDSDDDRCWRWGPWWTPVGGFGAVGRCWLRHRQRVVTCVMVLLLLRSFFVCVVLYWLRSL